MTFKKLNKSAQSILEYFILTAVVTTVVLFFASSPHFNHIKTSCKEAFNDAVGDILR